MYNSGAAWGLNVSAGYTTDSKTGVSAVIGANSYSGSSEENNNLNYLMSGNSWSVSGGVSYEYGVLSISRGFDSKSGTFDNSYTNYSIGFGVGGSKVRVNTQRTFNWRL